MSTWRIVAEPVSQRPRLGLLDYFTLNIYWFALSFLWNSMGPILLPTLVPLLVPDSQKGSALGLLSAIGLIVAIAVQPLAGELTDHRTTRWGKRRPYIVLGTLGDVVFLSVMAFSGNFWILAVAYLLLQTSSNMAHGPYQGYIPDLVPAAKCGAVSGVKQFLEIIGIIVTSLAVGNLVASGHMVAAFAAIIAILLITMAITAFGVREVRFSDAVNPGLDEFEEPLPEPEGGTLTVYRRAIAIIFNVLQQRNFVIWLVSRLFILTGANLVRNYALYFLRDVLRLPNPAAEVGSLMAIIAVAIALVVYPAGVLSDHIGRKKLVIASGLLGAVGALLLVSATSLTMVMVDGAVIGVSIGIFLSVNWAWAVDLIPAGYGGRYLGISNIATAGAGVLAGIGGVLLDNLNAQAANAGYPALYLMAFGCYILGTVVAVALPDRGSRGSK